MTITSPQIILTMSAAELLSATSPDTHTVADIDDLTTGEAARTLNYAIFEPDKWLLDGSFHLAPDPAHIGFVSQDISGAAGVFSSAPVLTLTLDAAITIMQGITLEFSNASNDYCVDLDVEYFDSGASSISSDNHTPTGYNYFAVAPSPDVGVLDVLTIEITFNTTSEAYRHLKLLGVYVDGVLFDKSDIKSAGIIEQIDPASTTLLSNELKFSLYSENVGFSIVDPQGVYAGLEENQPVDVYEFVDSSRIYMGRFYLKKWGSNAENIMFFECVDFVYQATDLRPTSKNGEFIYVSSGGGSYLETTFTFDSLLGFFVLGQIVRVVESSIASKSVTGFVNVKASLRDAIQLLCVGSISYATCARSQDLNVFESKLVSDISVFDYEFTESNIGQKPKISLKPLVTGLDIVSHGFPLDDEHVDFQVFDGSLLVDDYLFELNDGEYSAGSYSNTGTSTRSISEGVDHFAVSVSGAGTLVLKVITNSHAHDRTTFSERMEGLSADTKENIIEIANAETITSYNVADVLDFIYNYFQQRYICEFKLFASSVEVGDSVTVPIQGETFGGIVEKIESDLSGGFVQKIVAVGDILP